MSKADEETLCAFLQALSTLPDSTVAVDWDDSTGISHSATVHVTDDGNVTLLDYYADHWHAVACHVCKTHHRTIDEMTMHLRDCHGLDVRLPAGDLESSDDERIRFGGDVAREVVLARRRRKLRLLRILESEMPEFERNFFLRKLEYAKELYARALTALLNVRHETP